jgi:uncharacterized protein YnzC (UPF0291/DUF896 family)
MRPHHNLLGKKEYTLEKLTDDEIQAAQALRKSLDEIRHSMNRTNMQLHRISEQLTVITSTSVKFADRKDGIVFGKSVQSFGKHAISFENTFNQLLETIKKWA